MLVVLSGRTTALFNYIAKGLAGLVAPPIIAKDFKMKEFIIWGPSAGSSLIKIRKTPEARIKLFASTDFGSCHLTLDKASATKLRDALEDLLK